jgi:hypothetical protein
MKNETRYKIIMGTDLIEVGERNFSKKLMHKHGWSNTQANELVWEYKKFLYLSTILEAVIPPEIIDKVWHEHILFTEDYDRFTINVLGKKLQHFPDVPGAYVTDQKHWNKTLDAYVQEFGDTEIFQKYWLGLNAWGRYKRDNIKKRKERKRDYSPTYSSSCSGGSFMIFPIFTCSSCSSASSGCSSSSCGGGCGGGCGGS